MKLNVCSLFIVMLCSFSLLTACNDKKNNIAEAKAALGEKLFNDTSLSRDANQSCASCHNPEQAFIDSRVNSTSAHNNIAGAVSLGQDDISLGDINTPSAAYTAFVPEFHFDEEEGLFIGGLFLNGRAKNLTEQAAQPFLNPLEMQTNKEDVVNKVWLDYKNEFINIYGENIFNSTENAFNAIIDAIAEFEKTAQFAPFSSKFDRVLKGEAQFTEQEAFGMAVFSAEDKGKCIACHPLPTKNTNKQESLFTDFSYDNLGVPKNNIVRKQNGKNENYVDNGLFDNPLVDDIELKGAFRVPSLRNVAVTVPYMHNGVFSELKTVVHFYNTRDVEAAINPETGDYWQAAEVDQTKNTEELGNLKLTDEEEEAIVAFLKTLTDERYQPLLEQQ